MGLAIVVDACGFHADKSVEPPAAVAHPSQQAVGRSRPGGGRMAYVAGSVLLFALVLVTGARYLPEFGPLISRLSIWRHRAVLRRAL